MNNFVSFYCNNRHDLMRLIELLTCSIRTGKSSSSVLSSPVIHSRRTSEQRKPGAGITIAEATSWEPQTPAADKDRLEALTADDMNSAADLYGIRLKMEEKRKRIEAEKRQMEIMASRQREKVGKAAFLQVCQCFHFINYANFAAILLVATVLTRVKLIPKPRFLFLFGKPMQTTNNI